MQNSLKEYPGPGPGTPQTLSPLRGCYGRSEGLPLRDILSLRTLVGGWAGWECSAAVVVAVAATAVAGGGSKVGILKMDSPSRGACRGDPKLVFGTRDPSIRNLHPQTHKLGLWKPSPPPGNHPHRIRKQQNRIINQQNRIKNKV